MWPLSFSFISDWIRLRYIYLGSKAVLAKQDCRLQCNDFIASSIKCEDVKDLLLEEQITQTVCLHSIPRLFMLCPLLIIVVCGHKKLVINWKCKKWDSTLWLCERENSTSSRTGRNSKQTGNNRHNINAVVLIYDCTVNIWQEANTLIVPSDLRNVLSRMMRLGSAAKHMSLQWKTLGTSDS